MVSSQSGLEARHVRGEDSMGEGPKLVEKCASEVLNLRGMEVWISV